MGTASFSAGYTYSGQEQTITAESDTQTQLVGQYLTINPNNGECTFLTTKVDALSVSATMEVEK